MAFTDRKDVKSREDATSNIDLSEVMKDMSDNIKIVSYKNMDSSKRDNSVNIFSESKIFAQDSTSINP